MKEIIIMLVILQKEMQSVLHVLYEHYACKMSPILRLTGLDVEQL